MQSWGTWVLSSGVVVYQIAMYIQTGSIRTQCHIRERPVRVSDRSSPVGSLSATLKRTKNILDNVAVIQYAKLPHMTWSFQVTVCICLSALHMEKWLIGKRLWACLEAYLAVCILHPALTQKIDISDSRVAIWYVERHHTTCSFRVMSVRIHKILYQKVVCTLFAFITRQSYLTHSFN